MDLIVKHVRNSKPKQKCTVNQIRDLSWFYKASQKIRITLGDKYALFFFLITNIQRSSQCCFKVIFLFPRFSNNNLELFSTFEMKTSSVSILLLIFNWKFFLIFRNLKFAFIDKRKNYASLSNFAMRHQGKPAHFTLGFVYTLYHWNELPNVYIDLSWEETIYIGPSIRTYLDYKRYFDMDFSMYEIKNSRNSYKHQFHFPSNPLNFIVYQILTKSKI